MTNLYTGNQQLCKNGEWLFVVTGCSWYLDEMEGTHVSCHSDRVLDILGKGNSNQVMHYFVEKD